MYHRRPADDGACADCSPYHASASLGTGTPMVHVRLVELQARRLVATRDLKPVAAVEVAERRPVDDAAPHAAILQIHQRRTQKRVPETAAAILLRHPDW